MLRSPYSINFSKNDDLETVVKDFKLQIRRSCKEIKEQIERMGRFLKENKLVKENDICIEIKSYLKEEIDEHLISERTVDRYCPDSWKRKTKPKGERQMSFRSFKNELEDRVVTTTNSNVVSKGQILQQEVEFPKKSKIVEEKQKMEIQVENHRVMNSETQLNRYREEINKFEEAKGEIWTGNGSVKVGEIQLALLITVNSKLKKIEKVALDLHEFYLNNKGM